MLGRFRDTHRNLVHANLLSIRSWCGSAIHVTGGISSGRGTICRIGIEIVDHFCVKFICSLRLWTSGITATTCTTSSNTSPTGGCAIGRGLRGSGLWLVLALAILESASFSGLFEVFSLTYVTRSPNPFTGAAPAAALDALRTTSIFGDISK